MTVEFTWPPALYHQHKFVSPTHCETCGMPAGGWPPAIPTTTTNVPYTEAPRRLMEPAVHDPETCFLCQWDFTEVIDTKERGTK